MSEGFREIFLILIGVISWLVWIWLLFRGIEEYVFWMWGIMDEHDGKRCEKAIKNNTTIPYYCNTWTLLNN